MAKIKWSRLLNLTDLEFVPEPPPILTVSDELQQSISWLSGVTGYDRRLLRCDANGALLVSPGWTNQVVVETDELYPDANTPDIFTSSVLNRGVLVATSTEIITIGVVRVSGGATETYYVPPAYLFWLPYPIYSITATVVPADAGTPSYVGITAFS